MSMNTDVTDRPAQRTAEVAVHARAIDGQHAGPSRRLGSIVNALTVDVEDYFQVSALAPHIERHRWDQMECRIERNIERLLRLFDDRGARATFFTLGWIAVRYPPLVREIVEQGHELASHGQSHLRASEQSRADFKRDVEGARKQLEDIADGRGTRLPRAEFFDRPRQPLGF